MKIIGLQEGGFIVQMSRSELIALTGSELSGDKIVVNTRWYPILDIPDIAIRSGWDRLKALMTNRAELAKAIRQLRAIADVLEPLELVVCPEPETPATEGGAT
jgi:hypothetical protein